MKNELDIDKLNQCLLLAIENPVAKLWVDECFEMAGKFSANHGHNIDKETVEDRVVESYGVDAISDIEIAGKCWKAEILNMFFNDLYGQFDKKGLLQSPQTLKSTHVLP